LLEAIYLPAWIAQGPHLDDGRAPLGKRKQIQSVGGDVFTLLPG
jgi:hypothetical protein